jgi:ubiquinone/menaquinone biosynthesis C-methylase UbiE
MPKTIEFPGAREGKQEEREIPRKTILEIGSAESPVFKKFQNEPWLNKEIRNSNFFCLDISHGLLNKMESFEEEERESSMKVIRLTADARTLPFPADFVDTVFLLDVLSYRVLPRPIEDPQERLQYIQPDSVPINQEMAYRNEMLEEIFRVLKPGGKIIMGDSYSIRDPQAWYNSLRLLKSDPRYTRSNKYILNNGKTVEIGFLKKKKKEQTLTKTA